MPKIDRRKLSDVLWFAIQCAKDDRISFMDAVQGDEAQVKQAKQDIRAFELLQKKIFGDAKTKFETLPVSRPIGLAELKKLSEENPDLFTWIP